MSGSIRPTDVLLLIEDATLVIAITKELEQRKLGYETQANIIDESHKCGCS